MKESYAINITKECADVYYEKLKELPKDLKKQTSLYLLDAIFKNMVVPAIEKARSLDRNVDEG